MTTVNVIHICKRWFYYSLKVVNSYNTLLGNIRKIFLNTFSSQGKAFVSLFFIKELISFSWAFKEIVFQWVLVCIALFSCLYINKAWFTLTYHFFEETCLSTILEKEYY